MFMYICPRPTYETDEHILKHMHRPRREALLKRMPCHKAHWKTGHKQECARFQAEAEEKRRRDEFVNDSWESCDSLVCVLASLTTSANGLRYTACCHLDIECTNYRV